MKFNKNILTFAMSLAIFAPIVSNESSEENVTKLTDIEESIALEIVQEAITAVVSNPPVENAATTETTIQHEVSELEASRIIQEFTTNLSDGHKFTIEKTSFVIDTTRTINAAEQSIIEEIASELIDSTISAIANAIETAHTTATATPVSQTAAVVLLQQFISNLAAGNNFTLNGVSYTVQAASKTTETLEENK